MNQKLTTEIEPMRRSTNLLDEVSPDYVFTKVRKSTDSNKKVHMKIYKL
jgi:hypothetical protein